MAHVKLKLCRIFEYKTKTMITSLGFAVYDSPFACREKLRALDSLGTLNNDADRRDKSTNGSNASLHAMIS